MNSVNQKRSGSVMFLNSSRKKRLLIVALFSFGVLAFFFANSFVPFQTKGRLDAYSKTVDYYKSRIYPEYANELLTKLNATKVTYPNKESECTDYGNYEIYPSLFGFEFCGTYEFNSQEFTPKRGIVCHSEGTVIKLAVFAKNEKGEKIECYTRNSQFKCFPRTDSRAICGCDNCTDTSMLNNLPITDYKPSRKVMSFSAYGGRDYVCGILRQIRLAKVFFPDWSARVYLNSSVPRYIVDMVKREAQVVEIPSDSPFINSGMFWRLMVAEDEDVDVYCIRDSDSIFNYRESIAVEQWLASGKGFTSMHDHLYHGINIVGCCWCGRRRIKNINQKMLKWKHREKWGDDQDFLNSQIWPIMKNDVVVYDTCESRRKQKYEIPFPTERIACEFVGIAYRKGINIWHYFPYLCYPKKT